MVFIIVDDLNDMPLQPSGKPLVPTPNIDRLKAQGVTFTNAHTNDPLCAPSRASMLFGLYPQTTSLYWFENWQDNGIYKESVSLHESCAFVNMFFFEMCVLRVVYENKSVCGVDAAHIFKS